MLRVARAMLWVLGAWIAGCGDGSPPATPGGSAGAAVGGSAGHGGTAGNSGGTGGSAPIGARGGSAGSSFFSTGGSMAGGPAAGGQGGTAGSGDCAGYVRITSVADLATFAGRHCQTFDGSVIFYGYDSANLDFLAPSSLRTITGSLSFSQTDLKSLAGLAGLRSIGHSLSFVTNPALENLDGLESLEQLGADPTTDGFMAADNPMLTSVDALKNAKLTGTISIMSNDALTSLAALGHLRQSAQVQILGGNALTEIGLGELEECADCTISTVPKLTVLDLGKLRRAQKLRISANYKLPTLSLPSLESVEQGFTVTTNDELTSMGTLEKLTSVGMLQIAENPKLPQCFVDALGARLMACQQRCGSNDKAATCP